MNSYIYVCKCSASSDARTRAGTLQQTTELHAELPRARYVHTRSGHDRAWHFSSYTIVPTAKINRLPWITSTDLELVTAHLNFIQKEADCALKKRLCLLLGESTLKLSSDSYQMSVCSEPLGRNFCQMERERRKEELKEKERKFKILIEAALLTWYDWIYVAETHNKKWSIYLLLSCKTSSSS